MARRLRMIGLRLIGVLAVFAALAFLLAALVTALGDHLGYLWAYLIVGGIFALLALILFLLARRLARKVERTSAETPQPGAVAPLPMVLSAFLFGFAKGAIKKRR